MDFRIGQPGPSNRSGGCTHPTARGVRPGGRSASRFAPVTVVPTSAGTVVDVTVGSAAASGGRDDVPEVEGVTRMLGVMERSQDAEIARARSGPSPCICTYSGRSQSLPCTYTDHSWLISPTGGYIEIGRPGGSARTLCEGCATADVRPWLGLPRTGEIEQFTRSTGRRSTWRPRTPLQQAKQR